MGTPMKKGRTVKRAGRSTTMPVSTQASPEAKSSLPGSVTPLTDAILDRARAGDRSVLPELKMVLDRCPTLVRRHGDLAAQLEHAWISKIAGTDLVHQMSISRRVEQMKADLAGPSPTPLESLLVDRLLAAYLASQCADLAEVLSAGGEGVQLSKIRMQRAESAHRRVLAAAKSLAMIRRLSSGLRIEIQHTHSSTDSDGENPRGVREQIPVADRLRGLIQNTITHEEALASGATR